MKKLFGTLIIIIGVGFFSITHGFEGEYDTLFKYCTTGPHARGDVTCEEPYEWIGTDIAEKLNDVEHNLLRKNNKYSKDEVTKIKVMLRSIQYKLREKKKETTNVGRIISYELILHYVEFRSKEFYRIYSGQHEIVDPEIVHGKIKKNGNFDDMQPHLKPCLRNYIDRKDNKKYYKETNKELDETLQRHQTENLLLGYDKVSNLLYVFYPRYGFRNEWNRSCQSFVISIKVDFENIFARRYNEQQSGEIYLHDGKNSYIISSKGYTTLDKVSLEKYQGEKYTIPIPKEESLGECPDFKSTAVNDEETYKRVVSELSQAGVNVKDYGNICLINNGSVAIVNIPMIVDENLLCTHKDYPVKQCGIKNNIYSIKLHARGYKDDINAKRAHLSEQFILLGEENLENDKIEIFSQKGNGLYSSNQGGFPINEFGEIKGDYIEMKGGYGDAGCMTQTIYRYYYQYNELAIEKTCS